MKPAASAVPVSDRTETRAPAPQDRTAAGTLSGPTLHRRVAREVRALLWIRSRELMGSRRSSLKTAVLVTTAALWSALVLVMIYIGDREGLVIVSDTLSYVASAAWPLWALLPALGNGSGEVIPAARIAPYPVSHSGVFYAGWLTALVDIPYLLAVPVIVALATVAAGPAGTVAAIMFVIGASAVGQLLAWSAQRLFSGHWKRLLTAAALAAVGAGIAAMTGTSDGIAPLARTFGSLLPGEWLTAATDSAAGNRPGMWALWVTAIAAPVAITFRYGPRLAASAARHDANEIRGSSRQHAHGAATWTSAGSVYRAVTAATVRSVTRAATTRLSIVSLVVIPFVGLLPSEAVPPTVETIGAVAAVATAASLALNAFSFDVGGTVLLITMPVRRSTILAARATVIAALLTVVQVTAVALGAITLHPPMSAIVGEFVDAPARIAVLTALALFWSVLFPAPADHDSIRTRGAAPKSVLSFLVVSGSVLSLLAAGAAGFTGAQQTLVFYATSVAVAAAAAFAATRKFTGTGPEHVAYGVVHLD